MHISDIETRADEQGAVVYVQVGALQIRLELDNRERLSLCRALLGERTRTTFARVTINPLVLPKDVRFISEQTLNARQSLLERKEPSDG